jgi:hypothetical protein
MPIIASHNQTYRSEGHTPSDDWPEDCQVQWGGSGLVLKGDGGAYGTAFFEAFPAGGGFFRGEGADLEAAEADCLAKYVRFTRCDHLWGRGKYTNGGAICRRCGSFMTRFRPITRLGAWRDPITLSELSFAMDGLCRPDRADRFQTRLRLRLSRAGIKLPDPDLERRDYAEACEAAILSWYRENRSAVSEASDTGLSGLFDRLALRQLEREAC